MTVRYGCKDYACTLELAFDLIGGKAVDPWGAAVLEAGEPIPLRKAR